MLGGHDPGEPRSQRLLEKSDKSRAAVGLWEPYISGSRVVVRAGGFQENP